LSKANAGKISTNFGTVNLINRGIFAHFIQFQLPSMSQAFFFSLREFKDEPPFILSCLVLHL